MVIVAIHALFSDSLLAFLAIVSVIANGFILVTILTTKDLRKNENLYILTALSMADFLLALLLLPYITFLIVGWDYNANINYNAKLLLLLDTPVVFEIKVNSILTVAIAFDRYSALQWPISYKLRRRSLYTAGVLAVGLLWGTFDVTMLLTTAPFTANPGCAAAGCFFNPKFRYYRGVSDMFINAFTMAITILMLFKIRTVKVHPAGSVRSNNSSNESENAKLANANRIVLSVLLCSGVCVFLPSVFAGLGEMLGVPAFTALGPFVAIGLLASGVGNAFILGVKHTLIRQAIQSMWAKTAGQQSRYLRDVQNLGRA